MQPPQNTRPDDEAAALFNPAFCGALVNRACAAFVDKTDAPLPLTYAYIILPASLHKQTRENLPKTAATSMWAWIRENPLLFVDIAERVTDFKELTSEAILFGVRHGVLRSDDFGLLPSRLKRRPQSLRPTEDWESCMKTAVFLGKWFATSDSDEATTLARWGFRP